MPRRTYEFAPSQEDKDASGKVCPALVDGNANCTPSCPRVDPPVVIAIRRNGGLSIIEVDTVHGILRAVLEAASGPEGIHTTFHIFSSPADALSLRALQELRERAGDYV